MEPADPELEVLRRAYGAGVRFLLIGRQACMLYGLPVLSFDYDPGRRPTRRISPGFVAAVASSS